MLKKERCTGETAGTVAEIRKRKNKKPASLLVRYTVNGKNYTLHEKIGYTEIPVQIFGKIIFRIKKRNIKKFRKTVQVKYNKKYPYRAYLPENIGKEKENNGR